MKQKIQDELNKISQMTREQKWEYFKSYYLVKTIALVIGLALFVWFIKDTFFQKTPVNSGCVFGVEISDEERYALTEGYLDYYNYNHKKYCAYISTDNMFEGTDQQMDANSHEMALLAQVAAGEIYYFILDEENLNMLSNAGIYSSLDVLFSNGMPRRFENCAVEMNDPDSGEKYDAAIDLKKAGIFNDGREGYLVFTIGVPDSDYPSDFLNYLDKVLGQNEK